MATYGFVHYVCSIEEAEVTEYSDDEMPSIDGGGPLATIWGDAS